MAEDIFINKPIKNPDLNDALKRLKFDKSSDMMLEVLTKISKSVLVVPITTSENGSISFNAVSDSKKRKFIVVFSDTDNFEADKSYDSQKAVTSSFEDLMEVVLTPSFGLDGIVVNPGSSDVILGKELIMMINNQMAPKDDGVDIKVGDPDHYPERLYPMIKEFMRDQEALKKVYVRLFHKISDDVTSWMFILEVDGSIDERKYICETFNRFIEPYTDGLNSVSIDSQEEYASEVISGVKPFCER